MEASVRAGPMRSVYTRGGYKYMCRVCIPAAIDGFSTKSMLRGGLVDRDR